MGNLNRQITHYPPLAVEHPFDAPGPDQSLMTERRVALELSHLFKEIVPCSGGTDKVTCFHARQIETGETVRLKVLSRDLRLSAQLIELFQLEAETASQLSHSHIARSRPAEATDGLYFAVSEHRAGVETLRSRLNWSGWLETEEVAQIGIQIARALEYAHGCGILHLHLQPENILIDGRGSVLVTDFGIPARFHHESSQRESVRNIDACYLSPEQLRGGAVDQRSDLYGFGALLYEMLTDRVPFDSRDPEDIRRRHVKERPLALELIVPGIAGDFASAVMRLIAVDANKRFASAHEFLDHIHSSSLSSFDLEVAEPIPATVEPSISRHFEVTSQAATQPVEVAEETIRQTLVEPSLPELPVVESIRETEPLATLETAPVELADEPVVAPGDDDLDVVIAELEIEPLDEDKADLVVEPLPERLSSSPQLSNEPANEPAIEATLPTTSHVQSRLELRKPAAGSELASQIGIGLVRGKRWVMQNRRTLVVSAALMLVVGLVAFLLEKNIRRAAGSAPAAVSTPAVSDQTTASDPSQSATPNVVGEAILTTAVFGRPAENSSERNLDLLPKTTPTPTPLQETPVTHQATRLPQVANVAIPLTKAPAGALTGPGESRRIELPPPPPAQPKVEPKTEVTRQEPKPEPTRNDSAAGPNLVLGAVRSRSIPRYPHAARQAGIMGTVVVRVDVDERGRVQQARALSGPPLLRTEAEYAARSWRFEPSHLDGKPTTVTRTLSFDFKN